MDWSMVMLIKRLKQQNRIKVDVVAGELIIVQSNRHSCDFDVNKDGYLSFTTKVDGRRREICVHEVIAVIGNLQVANKQVYHVNGNKFDNRLINLTTTKPQEILVVEPEHLNIRRMQYKKSGLTEEQVIEIKTQLQLGEPVIKLAILYGVSSATIYNIKNGKSWKHVVVPEVVKPAEASKPTWQVHWQN